MNRLERILYVEDEPDVQTVAKLALEMVGGYQVLVCSSGEEALSQIAAFAPDLVLLDVMMPGMDGPSTLKALRTVPSFETVPVAFMTAKTQPEEVAYFCSLGARAVIAKPFDPMTLAERIATIWEGREGCEWSGASTPP